MAGKSCQTHIGTPGNRAGEEERVMLRGRNYNGIHGLLGLLVAVALPLVAGAAELHVPADFATIQAALDAAVNGDEVIISDGVYTGGGNKHLDFHGKAITVRSASGDPALCSIDCEGFREGFWFHSGETAVAVVRDLTIRNGSAYQGGGVKCQDQSSPTIVNCIITGNHGGSAGGGVSCMYGASPTLINCVIADNNTTTGYYGGGIHCYWYSSPTLINCAITGNSAGYGGGVYCGSANPTLANCTIAGNSAGNEGGGVYCYYLSPTLTNCILWGDTANEIVGSAAVSYCDIQGGWTAAGNIDADPLFVDPASGDFRLSSGSPCIDAGNNLNPPRDVFDLDGDGCVTEPLPVDLGGYTRYIDDPNTPDTGLGAAPLVDMGAYEFGATQPPVGGPCTADLNCDGVVDFDDINPFVMALCNPAAYQAAFPNCFVSAADGNNDGVVNFDDIDPFVALLSG